MTQRPLRAVAILAGGLATRMRPLTEHIPKALLDVAGKPFIEHQLANLASQGVQDVVLCVGYLGDMLQAHVGDGSRFGLRVQYSPDGPVLLGTGGALRLAAQRFPETLASAFFVLYGDSFLPIAYAPVQAAFAASKKPALMTVLANADRWDGSNVLWQNGALQRYSKSARTADMQHIDYGLGLLKTQLLHEQRAEKFDLAGLYETLSAQGDLDGFEVFERFYEIGSPQGLADTNGYFLKLEQTT
jgi:N-acetyl-alpha-D-muramate 1-phosphate uridylyltransferase